MSNISVDVQVDLSEFDKYVKDINRSVYAEVGILGAMTDEGISIADYGMAHEFGVIEHNLPRRSFIKDPLEAHLGNEIIKAEKTIGRYLEAGKIEKAVGVMGYKAVEVIKKAFETENDHKWEPLSETTIKMMSENRRKGWKILQDTGDLLSSISSKVVSND